MARFQQIRVQSSSALSRFHHSSLCVNFQRVRCSVRHSIKCSWKDDRAKSYRSQNARDMYPKTFRNWQEVGLTCLMVLATRLSSTGPRSSWRRWTSSKIRRRTIWDRATSPTLFLVTTSHFSGVVTNIWKKTKMLGTLIQYNSQQNVSY